jgi:predicted GIY-YIG superfamily endonuclease
MSGWVYMMADRYRGTIYTGVTADIARRTWQHRQGKGSKFVRKYQLLRLVYAEPYRVSTRPSPARRRSRNGGGTGKSI